MPIRLVLADGDLDILEALEHLLQREPDFHIVARCQSGEEALDAVRQHRPDVVILDLCLPGTDGLEVLRAMRQTQLPTPVVLLLESLHDDALLEAMRLGVGGVVPHERASQQLVGCIRKVYAGDHWLDSDTVGGAVETLLRREVAARERARGLHHQASADRDQGLR
jgi:two-component system, NarL family, nitrate/nitrite response regulator NarL